MVNNIFDEYFDLNKEIEFIRSIILSHETSYRTAMHEFVWAIFNLMMAIAKSTRLRTDLRQADNKVFRPHPRTTETWQLIKLCIHLTPATQASAHRWSQAIDVGLAAGWSSDEF